MKRSFLVFTIRKPEYAVKSNHKPAAVITVTGLPARTQEGLLQQAFEKIVKVKTVEVFADANEASIELENIEVSWPHLTQSQIL